MTKRRIRFDSHQATINFDQPIEAYQRLREDLLRENPPRNESHEYRYEECCQEIAVAIKQAIRHSGLSREQVVDGINDFFGWPKNDKRKSLTIHQFNAYLCKPVEYPIPAPYLHAICRVTGSLEPISALADMESARVIAGEELQALALGKIDNAVADLQRLKKTFRIQQTMK